MIDPVWLAVGGILGFFVSLGGLFIYKWLLARRNRKRIIEVIECNPMTTRRET